MSEAREARLRPRTHADLDVRTDGERISFDRSQCRARLRTSFEPRDDACRRQHPGRDLFLRHAGGRTRRDEISNELS